MQDWLTEHPDIRALRVAASDLNGVARGKRVPVSSGAKALAGSMRFPKSVLNLDIQGEDIEDSPLVLASGDQDGVLRPTERGFVPLPWLETPTALLPVWMYDEAGAPFAGDPRHALAAVDARLAGLGLRPVAAVELEFFLIDDRGDALRVPASPRSGKRRIAGEILSLRLLDQFDAFFTELYDGCAAMGIPADATISESGLGQFEVTLAHQDGALKVADDAWLFKMLAKGLARKHGFCATFMAKPYADYAGTGMHMHASLLDDVGRNVFDDGGPEGAVMLRHAIAGCLSAMPGSTLIFAPHANSYDRMVPGAHAPTGMAWAYENRTAAIRVPGGPPAARRIEHRMAGGDINPYLMLAAVLGAMANGIEDGVMPPAPITGNAYEQDLPQVPATWDAAIDAFDGAAEMARIFPDMLRDNLLMTKRQEARLMASLDPDERVEIYLDTV
ncbi:glutamine synthetase family protein [uncultured Tateyamaria sp.]|uniref:glutamine synthetase family protein n=1 Tax=Tateyamaria sp. 1078 TaxID=3417464 RepID=UPI0026090B4D|nr:glutamine synthetase family protein [uncultured Tateyamaria sp.]